MIRAVVVACIAAALYPAFSSVAGFGASLYNIEIARMTAFPALVGIAAAIACKKHEPLACSAAAASIAALIVGLAGLVWRVAFAGEVPALPAAALVSGHAARGIIAFFFGLGGGLPATFVLAFVAKPQQTPRRYKMAITAGAIVIVLWACVIAAKLVQEAAAP
ncbi:MAG: hypothetical protein HQ592_14205 [Planctomycetes bacterium]|nr:hypothetical protein [Planctomycetota bacterium]